jgi:aspartate dehydrogenase
MTGPSGIKDEFRAASRDTEMNGNSKAPRIVVIGYGAIADEMVRCLEARGEIAALAGILVRSERLAELTRKAADRFAVVDALPRLLDLQPDIVVEAAGHAAVVRFGSDILAQGFDLLIASVGALADQELSRALVATAAPGTELWIASGAVAGIDGLLAARSAGLRSVTYTSLKEPKAWNGTPAQGLLDEAAKTQRVIFFKGNAREAALQFPQNANVGATIALASLGLDRTRVQLGSDPHVAGPLGIIEAEGDFGRFDFEILALASATNPKTSALTGHSMVAAARDGMAFRALDILRMQG